MNTNVSPEEVIKLAEILHLIGQPVRIQILFILAKNSACVCHIEAVTGIRQAAVSQQLTILRKAGLVQSEREGRNIFYSITHHELIGSIYQVAEVLGFSSSGYENFTVKPVENCPCPRCYPGMEPELACQITSQVE